MSAPSGNKYAEKWTLERTLRALKTVEDYSFNSDCLYLGHALQIADLYDDIWRYWMRKWKRQYEVIHQMKRIMQRFEVRLFDKMARKEIPAGVGMFALKHHYGWGREAHPDDAFLDLSDEDKEPIPESRPLTESSQQIVAQRPSADSTRSGFHHMKIAAYNEAHPDHPITHPAVYIAGTPDHSIDAITFGDGYFLATGT